MSKPCKHYLQIGLPDVPDFQVAWIDSISVKGRYWSNDRTLEISVESAHDGEILGSVCVTCPPNIDPEELYGEEE